MCVQCWTGSLKWMLCVLQGVNMQNKSENKNIIHFKIYFCAHDHLQCSYHGIVSRRYNLMYYFEDRKKKLNPKIQILITKLYRLVKTLKEPFLKVLLYFTVTKTWLYNAGLYIKHAEILHFLNRWREWNVFNFTSLQHSISGLTDGFS